MTAMVTLHTAMLIQGPWTIQDFAWKHQAGRQDELRNGRRQLNGCSRHDRVRADN
jgi:hypothetical protein